MQIGTDSYSNFSYSYSRVTSGGAERSVGHPRDIKYGMLYDAAVHELTVAQPPSRPHSSTCRTSNQMDENEGDLINIGYGLKLAVSLAVMYASDGDGMRWKYE